MGSRNSNERRSRASAAPGRALSPEEFQQELNKMAPVVLERLDELLEAGDEDVRRIALDLLPRLTEDGDPEIAESAARLWKKHARTILGQRGLQ